MKTSVRTRRGWYKPVGAQLNTLLDAYEAFLNELGVQFERKAHEVAAQNNTAISCRRGCTACCRQVVAVSLAEALVIARYLLAYRRDQVRDLIEKITDQARRQEELGRAGWFALQEPCALLGAYDDCSIYHLRPAACRTYYVVSPPEQCYDVGGGADVVGSDTVTQLLINKSRDFMQTAIGERVMAYGTLGSMVVIAFTVLFEDSFDCLQRYGIEVTSPEQFEEILDGKTSV